MNVTSSHADLSLSQQYHVALHLAHRWFAYLEAPGGDTGAHLAMFHPHVRLSGHRGAHLFARDHESLRAWFEAVPDEISSHHIVHSNYSSASNGDGLLNMVVAYQAPGNADMHGSIISYETRIDFATTGPRFSALDKTPILPNKRLDYDTSWAANRVLARVHGELAGLIESDGKLGLALGGSDVRQLGALVAVGEGRRSYSALVTGIGGIRAQPRAVRLQVEDDGRAILPTIVEVEPLAP